MCGRSDKQLFVLSCRSAAAHLVLLADQLVFDCRFHTCMFMSGHLIVAPLVLS